MSHILKTIGVTSITDITDASKTLGINLTSATTGTTTTMNFAQSTNRIWTWPDLSSTILGTDSVQTITNKTIYEPSSTSISAAGTTQGTATSLTNTYNVITTVGAGSGVILSIPSQSGLMCVIINKGANTLKIYPNVGGTIDALGVNVSYTLLVNGSITLRSGSTTQWYSVGSFGIGGGGGSVTSLTGTVNQITASPSSGAVTVSTPSTFIAPGTIQDTSGMLYSTNATISAAGVVQGTATALTKSYNIVTTVNSGTGVLLPTPTVGGYVCVVVNKGANVLRCYPNSGAQIDTGGANIAYQIASNSIVEFRAATTTQWYSFGGITPGSGASSLITELNSGTPFATTSVTDVLITDMTYTIPVTNPVTRCLLTFNSTGTTSVNNSSSTYSVYYNGVQVTNSERNIQPPGNGAYGSVNVQVLIPSVSVGGVIDVRVRTSAGTTTVSNRSFVIIGFA